MRNIAVNSSSLPNSAPLLTTAASAPGCLDCTLQLSRRMSSVAPTMSRCMAQMHYSTLARWRLKAILMASRSERGRVISSESALVAACTSSLQSASSQCWRATSGRECCQRRRRKLGEHSFGCAVPSRIERIFRTVEGYWGVLGDSSQGLY